MGPWNSIEGFIKKKSMSPKSAMRTIYKYVTITIIIIIATFKNYLLKNNNSKNMHVDCHRLTLMTF